jgi:hypothetical protein
MKSFRQYKMPVQEFICNSKPIIEEKSVLFFMSPVMVFFVSLYTPERGEGIEDEVPIGWNSIHDK